MTTSQLPVSFGKKLLGLVALFYLVRLLVNIFMPLIDPSEGRYAAMIGNMVRLSDFSVPQFFHRGEFQVFAGKPPLFFWLGGGAAELTGINEFAVRFPSLLGAVVILLLIYFLMKRFYGLTEAVLAVVFCGMSAFFYVFAGLAQFDMLLSMTVAGAVFCYAGFEAETVVKQKKWWSMGVFVSLALGMLTKGPVGIALAGLPIFCWVLYNRKWANLKFHAWGWGLLLFFAIALPWFVMMASADPGFLEYFFIDENIKRFLFEDYGDRYGSGRRIHYGAAVWMFIVANLPWLLILLKSLCFPAQRKMVLDKGLLAHPVSGLSISAFVTMTVFWSLTATLPIAYLLPTVPFFACYLAVAVARMEWEKWFLPVVQWVMIAVGSISVLVLVILSWNYTVNLPKTTKYIISHIQKNNPGDARKIFFFGNSPYSAEFYGGDAVHYDLVKAADFATLANPEKFILVMSGNDYRRLKTPEMLRIVDSVGDYYIVELTGAKTTE